MATPDREEIIGLREQGMTREKIAEHYDVSITTVRRWIKQHNIPRPSKQARRKRESHLSRNGEIIAPLQDERPILEQAQEILGDRFTEKRFVGLSSRWATRPCRCNHRRSRLGPTQNLTVGP